LSIPFTIKMRSKKVILFPRDVVCPFSKGRGVKWFWKFELFKNWSVFEPPFF
jgi:hypothetical protein